MKHVVLSFLCIMLIGCYYDVEETLYGSGCPDVIVSYDASIEAILINHCTVCHSGPNAQNGKDFTTYESVRQATLEGSLLEVLKLPQSDSRAMPPNGSLDSCTIQLIENWANLGAPEF